MRVADIFRRDIGRRIEEVIKVDLSDERIVAEEIDEYVVTDNIRSHLEELVDAYQDSARNPSDQTNVWVSGFFGSGKSSFAKVLGYSLANTIVEGRYAADRLLERVGSQKLEALLATAHQQAPAVSVFLDLATGRDVIREGESLVLPAYRALLERLGYSRNVLLAELEFALEGDGDLDAFESVFREVTQGKDWASRRNVGLARSEASHALHKLRPETYPQPDSWARAAVDPEITHNWFANRALELLHRRGNGARRVIFVVDEVGQYVARSIDRMLDLQGLAEACQKHRGPLWLVVTSQEKLDDIVDSLERKRVELARVKDRFPLQVDLLPRDIHEVASRRLLDKTDAGQDAVRLVFGTNRNKLAAHVHLESPTRSGDFSENEFVRLYPMVPYQFQLLIDAVSARRAQGGGSPMLGGSNRTIIKLAQQLVVDPEVGLGKHEVGDLVTLDRAAVLLESVLPTSWQDEIRQVADKYGSVSARVAVMRAVALCCDVPALRLNEVNLAVLLHPSVTAESQRADIAAALKELVIDDRLRFADDGYQIQSPEQKDWEKSRRGKEPRPADAMRIRKELLGKMLAGVNVTRGRTFKISVTIGGERLSDGDVDVHIDEADSRRRETLRELSRETSAQDRITWTYSQGDDTYDALVDLYRSDEMIRAKDTPSKTAADVELLAEERQRLSRAERQLTDRLGRDLLEGQVVFRGRIEDIPSGSLSQVAPRIVSDRLIEIFSRVDDFAANLSNKDVMTVLRADDLAAFPPSLGESGIGLVNLTPEGYRLATEDGPLSDLLHEVQAHVAYGHVVTGAVLEREFSKPPRGAPMEVIQALAAAAVRAGLLEVTYQGQRIASAADHRLDRVFGRIPDFRSASFAPPATDGPSLEARVAVAERLGALTGAKPPIDPAGLAAELRRAFGSDVEVCATVIATLNGADLQVPEVLTRTQNILGSIRDGSDSEAISSAADTWADLVDGRESVRKLRETIDEDLPVIRRARAEIRAGSDGLPDRATSALTELADLVAAGDFLTHRGRIRALTDLVGDARRLVATEVAARLLAALNGARGSIRERFASLGENKVEEALRRLDELGPPDDATTVPLVELRAREALLDVRANEATQLLEELQAAGNLARIAISELVRDPITTLEELDVALERVREAVSTALADGKQVRLL